MRPYRPSWGVAKSAICAIAAIALLAAAGCGSDDDHPQPSPDRAAERIADRFDAGRAFADLAAQVRLGPRPAGSAANRRQTRLIARRLRRAGARDVRIQRPYRNVVGTIPGSEPGAVAVGAHHDTVGGVPGFVGANDGASGVAVVLELARALPDRLDGPSVHLVLFDAEEARPGRSFEADGTRGSRQYMRYASAGGRQGSPRASELEAMVLFDLVGDCDLRIPLEANSDPHLYGRFHDAALALDPEGGGAPFRGETDGVLDDHTPFSLAGVPALDLIDFDFGPGRAPGGWWHTRSDDLSHVCHSSLAAVGRPSLVALTGLG